MDNTIDAADAEVIMYLGSPERLMTFAEQGHLSKFTLASLLGSDASHFGSAWTARSSLNFSMRYRI
jgi:hypothetical protein